MHFRDSVAQQTSELQDYPSLSRTAAEAPAAQVEQGVPGRITQRGFRRFFMNGMIKSSVKHCLGTWTWPGDGLMYMRLILWLTTMGIFNLHICVLNVVLHFLWEWRRDCTRVSTDSGSRQKAFCSMSKGNFSDAHGALSSVKEGHKNSSGVIVKKKSSSNFLLLLRYSKT